mmetsp:Transcript_42669/g.100016  ORF Transcript_42669/g.100016 Transcript_42669/m.100016 type:complete len:230 (-) Transcript_42669:163-852(-)
MARRLSANAYATRRAGRPWCSETVPATWPRRERHVSGGHVSGAWSIDGVCFLTKRWTAASTYLLTPTYVVTPHPRACVGWRVPAASTSSPHPRVAPLWRVSAASATGAPSAPRRILPRRLLPVGEGARRFSHHPLPFDRAAGVVAEGYITNPLRQRSQGASRARLRMHVAHPPGRFSLPPLPACKLALLRPPRHRTCPARAARSRASGNHCSGCACGSLCAPPNRTLVC